MSILWGRSERLMDRWEKLKHTADKKRRDTDIDTKRRNRETTPKKKKDRETQMA